jgi:hypothetical protein
MPSAASMFWSAVMATSSVGKRQCYLVLVTADTHDVVEWVVVVRRHAHVVDQIEEVIKTYG